MQTIAKAKGITDINVLKRLCTLRRTLDYLKGGKDGGNDQYKLAKTVEVITSAYEKGNLGWNDGLVTYWSCGKQLSEPRTFIQEEFEEIADKHKGHQSFWVEGVSWFKSLSNTKSHICTLVFWPRPQQMFYPTF